MSPDREKHRAALRARIDAHCSIGTNIYELATNLLEALEAIAPHLRTSTEPPAAPPKSHQSRGELLRREAATADAFDIAVQFVREARLRG